MHNFAYGDTRLDFPYGNNFIMHTVSDCNIPVWIQASPKSPYAYYTGISVMRSPYAYGDHRDPRMHTGIQLNSRMHTGIGVMQSLYAYRDL